MLATLEASPERAIGFATIINAARTMLDNPELIAQLDDPTLERSHQILDGVFLPDVTERGIIRLPAQQRETDNMALIPLLSTDQQGGGLQLAGSMYGPTHSRLLKLNKGLSLNKLEGVSTTRSRLAHEGLAISYSVGDKASDMPPNLKARTGLFTDSISADLAVPLFTSRPHIFMRPGVAQGSPITAGVTVLHELKHGEHLEQLDKLPEGGVEEWFTKSELETTYLTMICLKAAGVETDEAFMKANGFWASRRLEARRQRLNTSDNPYDPKPELIATVLGSQLEHNPIKLAA